MNHALLGLSPNIPPGPKEGDLAHDMSHEAAAHKRNHTDKGESRLCHMSNALPVKKKKRYLKGAYPEKTFGDASLHDPSCADQDFQFACNKP